MPIKPVQWGVRVVAFFINSNEETRWSRVCYFQNNDFYCLSPDYLGPTDLECWSLMLHILKSVTKLYILLLQSHCSYLNNSRVNWDTIFG